MTLFSQVIEAIRAKGYVVDTQSHKVRLTQTPGMWPLNGSVVIDGDVVYDYFCNADSQHIDVCKAE